MLSEILNVNSDKARIFQVLLLSNDTSQDVKIEETNDVDFQKIQEHLKHGGSVFITSKNSQKLYIPKEMKKAQRKKNKTKTVTAFYFDHI